MGMSTDEANKIKTPHMTWSTHSRAKQTCKTSATVFEWRYVHFWVRSKLGQCVAWPSTHWYLLLKIIMVAAQSAVWSKTLEQETFKLLNPYVPSLAAGCSLQVS